MKRHSFHSNNYLAHPPKIDPMHIPMTTWHNFYKMSKIPSSQCDKEQILQKSLNLRLTKQNFCLI